MYKTSSKNQSKATFSSAVYNKKHEEKPEIPPMKLTTHAWLKPLLDEDTFRVGRVRTGKVIKVFKFGAVIDMHGIEGFIHISEMADHWIKRPSEVLHKNSIYKFKILSIVKLEDKYKISLTLKGVTQSRKLVPR